MQSQSSKMTTAQKNSKIINDVKKRGVTFTLIPQIETSLKEAGASDALIRAIREKSSSPRVTEIKTNKIKPVSSDFWDQQREKTMESRDDPVGSEIEEIIVPEELNSGTITKQLNKISEMKKAGYEMPMDFPDLAKKISNGEIVILPSATENYLVEIGSRVTGDEFTEFIFDKGSKTLSPNAEKIKTLNKVAQMFDNLDLKKSNDRKDFKGFLLTTLQPQAKLVLEENSFRLCEKVQLVRCE